MSIEGNTATYKLQRPWTTQKTQTGFITPSNVQLRGLAYC